MLNKYHLIKSPETNNSHRQKKQHSEYFVIQFSKDVDMWQFDYKIPQINCQTFRTDAGVKFMGPYKCVFGRFYMVYLKIKINL